jgi:DNA-binding NarL/FixJ family response regulator
MPELEGIEATRQLAGPDVVEPLAIAVITTFDLDEYVHGALKAGARGFLLKDAGPALLAQAIHAAADGYALITPSVTARLLAEFSDTHTGQPPAQPIEPLTRREEEVLITVAHGWTNSEIADDLHISLGTVKSPRQPQAQAPRSEPRRDRDVGVRNGAHQELTTQVGQLQVKGPYH